MKPARVVDHFAPDELLASGEPAVIKGLVKHWGLVQAGLRSDQEAMQYILSFYNGKVISASFGDASINGRLFYTADFTRLNFDSRRSTIDQVLKEIEAHWDEEQPPTHYIASTVVDACLPGFRKDNDVELDTPPAIWIGSKTIASCHYDAPNNLACCAVGRRRFTMFPPEQIFNLYPGPLDPSPGGQAVSTVNFSAPDFNQHPHFRAALESAHVAELEPGDAVFVPSMWWHHVEGLSRFNTLVNYWWSTAAKFIPTPMNTLYQAIWSIRDRPEREKQAWKQVFEYYVFGPSERAGAHLPEQARGVLGPMDDDLARQIRAMLLNNLNR
jgi:cupin-like protein